MEVEGKRLDELILDKLCELCSERNANGYCVECELLVCKTCFENHLKAKPCRDHVLTISLSNTTAKGNNEIRNMSARGKYEVTDGTEINNGEVKCDIHVKETIRFYCKKHEIVGCGDCIFLNHKKCEVDYIKDVADRYMTESFRTKLEQIEKEVEFGIEKVKLYQENNETCNKTALEKIHKFRQEIENMLDQAEEKLCTETKELCNKYASDLSKVLDSYGSVRRQYSSLKEGLCGGQHHQYKDFINTVRAKPLLSVLEKSLDELKSNTKSLMYHFQSNPSIKLDLGYLQKEETVDCKETTQDRSIIPPGDQAPKKEEHVKEFLVDYKPLASDIFPQERKEDELLLLSEHKAYDGDILTAKELPIAEQMILSDYQVTSTEELKKDTNDAMPNRKNRHGAKSKSSVIKDWNLCVRSITLSSNNENALGIIEGNGGKWKIHAMYKNWLLLEIQPHIIVHRLCLRANINYQNECLQLVVNGGESVKTLGKIRSLEICFKDSGSLVTLIEDCDRYYKIIRVEVSMKFFGTSKIYGLSLIGKLISGEN